MLSAVHKKFCREYVIDFNRTRAYLKAFPKCTSEKTAKTSATRLLKKPEINSYILKLLEEQEKRAEKKADDIIAEMEKIAFSNIKDYVEIEGNSVTIKKTKDIPDDKAAAIKSVSETAEGCLKIHLHNKLAALELLGRRFGIFPNKTEHSGPDGKPLPAPTLVIFKPEIKSGRSK